MIRRLAALTPAALLALSACSGGQDDSAVRADEDRQLNDAAAMLDANSVDANAASPEDAAPDPTGPEAATNGSTP